MIEKLNSKMCRMDRQKPPLVRLLIGSAMLPAVGSGIFSRCHRLGRVVGHRFRQALVLSRIFAARPCCCRPSVLSRVFAARRRCCRPSVRASSRSVVAGRQVQHVLFPSRIFAARSCRCRPSVPARSRSVARLLAHRPCCRPSARPVCPTFICKIDPS
ncbi:unnamed protein product [Ectocarpus sp. 8 AP-2014]